MKKKHYLCTLFEIFFLPLHVVLRMVCIRQAGNGYDDTDNIQKNQPTVDAHREERRCACLGSHWGTEG